LARRRSISGVSRVKHVHDIIIASVEEGRECAISVEIEAGASVTSKEERRVEVRRSVAVDKSFADLLFVVVGDRIRAGRNGRVHEQFGAEEWRARISDNSGASSRVGHGPVQSSVGWNSGGDGEVVGLDKDQRNDDEVLFDDYIKHGGLIGDDYTCESVVEWFFSDDCEFDIGDASNEDSVLVKVNVVADE